MAVVSSVPSQCGMRFISSLGGAYNEDLSYQIKLLKEQVFGFDIKPVQAMAIFTDYEAKEETMWRETKKVAFKSEWRINPNTHRNVRVYIVYPEHIKELEAMLPPTIVDKIVEQIKSF